MTTRILSELAEVVHVANKKWWVDLYTEEPLVRDIGELLMLTISEISEAMEGARKNLMDDKIPSRPMEEVELADAVIRLLDFSAGNKINLKNAEEVNPSFPDVFGANKGRSLFDLVKLICKIDNEISHSLLDASYQIYVTIKSIEAYAEFSGYDLWGAYDEKMAYNAIRADHQKESRLSENGKKW